MTYVEAIEPVTTLKSRSAELVRRARESGQPIIITQNGKATAVLQDVESYQRQRQALLLLRYLARGDRDHRQGKLLARKCGKCDVPVTSLRESPMSRRGG